MFGRIMKGILIGAIAVGLLLALAPWWVVARDVATGGPYQEYLADHVQRLDLSGSDPDLDFPDTFYDHRLFLVGEIHGAEKAQRLDLALMTHLAERAGVRWLMAELDPAQAGRFNAYLETGDASLVRPVFEAWLARATQWGNQEHFEKLRALREWNERRPEAERLRYFGVDWIQDVDGAVAWLARELERRPAEAGSETTAASARERLRDRAREFDGDLEALLTVAGEADAALHPETRHLVRSLRMHAQGAGRYEAIEANIDAMVNDFGIGDHEPLYGFWGIFHVLKARVDDSARPLALRLRDSGHPFADGIVSLIMVYADAEMNMPSRSLPEAIRPEGPFFDAPMSQDDPYLQYLKGIRDLKVVADGADAAIFRLDAEGSPYEEGDRLIRQQGLMTKIFPFEVSVEDGRPTEYVILVNGSDALTPFEG